MPLPLRADFGAPQLRSCARKTKDAPQARRLLALAAIYDGATRTQAAEIGGVTVQIVRDWVVKFNAEGPEGLIDRKAPGQASRLNDTHRAALVEAIDEGPIPAIHGVVRWRLIDLCQWVFEEFRVTVSIRRSAASCGRWDIVGSPLARVIMRRPKGRSRILKNPSRAVVRLWR
jgi:transposase